MPDALQCRNLGSRHRRDDLNIRGFSSFALNGVRHTIPGRIALKVAISLKFVSGLASILMRRSSMSSHQIVGVDFHCVVLRWHPHWQTIPPKFSMTVM